MPLSQAEKNELKKHWDTFDKDGDGHITVPELGVVMKSIGENATDKQLKDLIAEVDLDANGTIEWDEFCSFIEKFRAGKSNAKGFGEVFVKNANLNVVSTGHATHSFSDEERASFVEHINMALGGDKDVAHLLPMNPDAQDIFKAVRDGILLCKLINYSVKGTIDERAINKATKINNFQITENQNLCINSAKGIGCTVVNVGSTDLIEGKVHIVLGLLWQIIRIGLLSAINLKDHPYLVRLLEPGETLQDLLKLSPEQILLRWFNYHLKNAGHPRRVNNFTTDIKDSENYTILLNQLAPKQCGKEALQQSDPLKRAEMVLNNADKIGCKKFVRPNDIVKANGKLNLAFVANLFNTCPGLEPVEEVILIEDIEESREEKAFRNWINSLGVDPYVNHLFEDLRDGIIILQVLDNISPGIVDWKRVNTKKPLNKFKQVENCNYAIVLGKQLKFSLVGIGGEDINNANKKLTLAIVWQSMRFFVLNFLKKMSKGGKEVTEQDIVDWANSKVATGGKGGKIDSLRDKLLADSIFIIDLLACCQPQSVDYSLVTPGGNDDERRLNAQYAISCARKMGCSVFLLWEDIVEVQPKMMLTFLGAIMSTFGGV